MSFLCNICECKCKTKETLAKHIRSHTNKLKRKQITCFMCKKQLANRKLLANHIKKEHPKRKLARTNNNNKTPSKHKCVACHSSFPYNCQLRYHIRKSHFNLITQTPCCEIQNVNQVWFEKVLNTNIIVEIKKIDHNFLLLRKLNDNTSIKVTEIEQEVIDLRMMYPINEKRDRVQCRVCSVQCFRMDLGKHFVKVHGNLIKKCDLCKRPFTGLVSCIKHVCPMSVK